MTLRTEMRAILDSPIPEDGVELRQLLGRADEALRRSVFGIREAKSKETALEVLLLPKKLRRRRIELFGEVKNGR